MIAALLAAHVFSVAATAWAQKPSGEELVVAPEATGQPGGRLVVSLRTEPKTFNPVTAADSASREVIGRMMADLIRINRSTQQTEPSLAKSWKVSADGRRYTMHLQHGLRFSDGHPLDADDVVFTFQAYLDEQVHSPQRELLLIGGKPILARKVDSHTVEFELARPYAPAERLFDSIAILPQHLLGKPYAEGKLGQSWGLTTPPEQIAGMGAFRLKEYVAGQRIVLERNPHFWKTDRQKQRLPYLDEIVFVVSANEDAQVLRFQAGETDLLSRINAKNFAALQRDSRAANYRLMDMGPGLEYSFLFFNLNHLAERNLPEVVRKQAWFRDVRFRQAVSTAIDREGIVRLVYQGRAAALSTHVTPGNRLWRNADVGKLEQSLDRARQLLRDAGFSWNASGALVDPRGQPVEFSIVTSASNAARAQMATIIQDDLKKLGMAVHVVPIEFRSLLDRVLNTFDYEAAISGLISGDVDPNAEMNVWMSSGATHLWNLSQALTAPWEAEIDDLMRKQMVTLQYGPRKKLYDRVQQIVAENLPLVCLVSPNVLLGVKSNVGNLKPAILEPYALWNAEELFLERKAVARK